MDISEDKLPKMRKIGVMGGTFDPIHYGHLVAASEAAALFSLDKVIFVPAGDPWHKQDRDEQVTDGEDRYLMTVLATASNPQFSVSRVDIDRDGYTYTFDTLRDVKAQYVDAELYFITGTDALNTILNWQNWHELFELAQFVGVSRPGYQVSVHNLNSIPWDKVTLIEIPALAISSTDCRRRAREGRPIWYLVPDAVVRYIDKRQLYSDKTIPIG